MLKKYALMSVLFIFAMFVTSSNAAAVPANPAPWLIKKSAWTAIDERGFSQFVTALGESGCKTVEKCMKSPANPYRSSDPRGMIFDADCGKFPYLLRAYYAWKNNLPFSYANQVDSADGAHVDDIRYSPNGNVVKRRRAIVQLAPGHSINAIRAMRSMQNEVLTAMYRLHPLRDGRGDSDFSDFYSVSIDRTQVRPGTVVYDAAGHVVVVYKVEPDGRVRYFDAHPDRTISRGVFGQKFARSRPGAGAGFKNFRSLELVGAAKGAMGELVGGSIRATPLQQTPGFSLEQYFGTERTGAMKDSDWERARFKTGGREMGFFNFVRARLAIGELKYKPIIEMTNAIDSLCGDLRDRVDAVQTAVDAGIHGKDQPARLPGNIFGTSGEWEEFSTPSRDARLKTSFKELRDRIQEMVEMHRQGDTRIEYTGSDLASDLRLAYATAAVACVIEYRRSNGTSQAMNFEQVIERLFAMSFDPYHCPEMRWGATSAEELATCPDGNLKRDWYKAEQRLRNQIERTYDLKMGFSLGDLLRPAPGSGIDAPPDVNLWSYLKSL